MFGHCLRLGYSSSRERRSVKTKVKFLGQRECWEEDRLQNKNTEKIRVLMGVSELT